MFFRIIIFLQEFLPFYYLFFIHQDTINLHKVFYSFEQETKDFLILCLTLFLMNTSGSLIVALSWRITFFIDFIFLLNKKQKNLLFSIKYKNFFKNLFIHQDTINLHTLFYSFEQETKDFFDFMFNFILDEYFRAL